MFLINFLFAFTLFLCPLHEGHEHSQEEIENSHPFMKIVKDENIEMIKDFIKEKGVNFQDGNGITPLMISIAFGKEKAFDYIIANKADIDKTDNNGSTALIAASFNGNLSILKKLIENGANINHQDSKGYTALLVASTVGKKDIVELLLKNGANINLADNNGYTPIVGAIMRKHVDVIKTLLTKIDLKKEKSLIILASMFLDKEIVSKFIDSGADINFLDSHKRNALFAAINSKNFEVAKFLISKKIDLNKQDLNGHTPLFIASFLGEKDLISDLIKSGADKNLKDKTGKTASDYLPKDKIELKELF